MAHALSTPAKARVPIIATSSLSSPSSVDEEDERIDQSGINKRRRHNVTPFWVNHPTIQGAIAAPYRQIVPEVSSNKKSKWNDLAGLLQA